MNLTFQTTEDDVNTRLDHYLNRSTGEEISRTSIQKWIKLGYIVQSPNNQTVKSGQKVKLGEIFTIHIPPRTNTHLQPISMDIPILLEEEDFIIIQKPAAIWVILIILVISFLIFLHSPLSNKISIKS